jgi:hypothetical protein
MEFCQPEHLASRASIVFDAAVQFRLISAFI